MLTTTKARLGATFAAIAPVILLVGFLYHPFITYLPDSEAVSSAVTPDTTRWALAHLTVAVGSGLAILAFFAIHGYLREAGEERWSVLGLPFIVMGSTLYTLLPGMEFAVLAAAETGSDVQAAQTALLPWFVPILVISAITFALGVLGFAMGVARSRVLGPPGLTWLVVGALVVMAIARFIPLGVFQFYVQGAAGIVALWPLAYVMWKRPEPRSA